MKFADHQRCALLPAGIGGVGMQQSSLKIVFPNVSRKILHNPCRAHAWSNKNLFRTVRKKIFSAPKNWCLNSARSWGLEWETEALSSSEQPTKIWLLNRNLNFPRAALTSRFRTRAEPCTSHPGTGGTAWLLFLLWDIQTLHPKRSSLCPRTPQTPGMPHPGALLVSSAPQVPRPSLTLELQR